MYWLWCWRREFSGNETADGDPAIWESAGHQDGFAQRTVCLSVPLIFTVTVLLFLDAGASDGFENCEPLAPGE
jgi:hypothetical protein